MTVYEIFIFPIYMNDINIVSACLYSHKNIS